MPYALYWNIVPNREDVIHVGKVFLRPNKIHAPYPDLENYCDVQFRLMMEDFMYPLRQAILAKLYPEGNKANSPNIAIRVYEDVTFWRGGLVNNARLIPERHTSRRYYHVKFRKLPKVNWETIRRLIHGSLSLVLCLSMGRRGRAYISYCRWSEVSFQFIYFFLLTKLLDLCILGHSNSRNLAN